MSLSLVPGSVLVGIDGSAGSYLALTWAATYAQSRRLPLVVVHATGLPVVTDFAIDIAATEDGLLAAGRRATDRAVATVAAKHPTLGVTGHAVVGDPRAVLKQLAEGASTLVLGSRGRGALASLLLGSVSVALAAHAPCPVVVVRPHSEIVAPGHLSVVVGVDGAEDAADALMLGFELASSQYRPLLVLHALGSAVAYPYADLSAPDVEEQLLEISERLLSDSVRTPAEKFPDVVVHRRSVRETPTEALVAASRSASAVVVGCRGRGPARSHLLGSVSRSVVERAHCTVVVVRGADQ
jgi:nucleotide-binding universal stress UspA family protein